MRTFQVSVRLRVNCCSKIRMTNLKPRVYTIPASLLTVCYQFVDVVGTVDPPQSIDVDVYLDCMSSLN